MLRAICGVLRCVGVAISRADGAGLFDVPAQAGEAPVGGVLRSGAAAPAKKPRKASSKPRASKAAGAGSGGDESGNSSGEEAPAH